MALGGNADKTGHIDSQRMIKIVRDDFGMTIKIEKLLDDMDRDKDGKISYSEFSALFA